MTDRLPEQTVVLKKQQQISSRTVTETAAELTRKKGVLTAQLLKKTLAGEDTSALRAALLAVEEALPAQETASAACAQCGDTGFVAGRPCVCLLDEIYQKSYFAENPLAFDEEFAASDLSVMSEQPVAPGETQRSHFALLQNVLETYARKFPENRHKNLVLTGGTGLGKSFLLRAAAKEVRRRGYSVLFMTAPELNRTFLAHRLGEGLSLKYLYTAALLALDDLGTEPMLQNVTVEYLEELLDRRMKNGLHTVVSTNQQPDQLLKRYGERVYSRLFYKNETLTLDFLGRDIRSE